MRERLLDAWHGTRPLPPIGESRLGAIHGDEECGTLLGQSVGWTERLRRSISASIARPTYGIATQSGYSRTVPTESTGSAVAQRNSGRMTAAVRSETTSIRPDRAHSRADWA